MKKYLGIATGVCMLLAANAFAASRPPSAQQQIQPMLNEMLRLANAHDTDRFMTFYLHQPSLIYVNNGIVIHGWNNLRAQQLKWWKNGMSDVVYRTNGATEFTVLAPSVVVVTEPRVSTRTGTDGKPRRNEFVVSETWEKLPEGWRVVYGHESGVHSPR